MNSLYKHALWIALAMSVATIGMVFIAQYGFDLHPCVLCIYQRWPYAAIMALVVLWFFLRQIVSEVIVRLLVAASFATTAGIAAYHVGVEQGWWEGTAECAADTSAGLSIEQLREQLMTAPIVKCNEIAWELFGISMAGYNFIFAAAMAIFMVLSVRYLVREVK